MSDESDSQAAPEEEAVELDPAQAAFLQQRIQAEQNLAMGAVAGVVASLAGAAAWAGITIVSGYQIGFMAIGVGFLVGYAIRIVGKGTTTIFGVVGAVLSLFGCALGNLLAMTGVIASENGVPFLDALSQLTPELIQDIMVATFSAIDLLFYAIAVYEGYRLSFRQYTSEEIQGMISGGTTPTG